jgi:hypothetical protein
VGSVKIADSLKVEDRQSIRSKRRRAKRLYFVAFASLLLLSCTVGSVFSLVEYQTYKAEYNKDASLAQEGMQHLRMGVALLEALPRNPLDSQAVDQAQHEFTSASTRFVQVDNDLKSLPGISMSVPTYGAQLRAALHVLPLAIEVSQVGADASNTLSLLIARLHDPLNTQEHGLTLADLTVVEQNFRQIKAMLNLIIDQVNHLQPADLQFDSRLGKLVTTFHEDLPILQTWLDVAQKLLPVAPTLLGIGTPTNYLIEMLDSTELRPGGGFIGNYGIATFSGGRLTAAHITDVDLLDRPFEGAGGVIPFPSTYTWFDIAPTWSLRDSNLDADFPTAARYGELTYKREGGDVPVQGVIAITPTLIQHALDITGPISVPEYHETINAQNLIARIHYYQLGPHAGSDLIPSPDGHSSERKRFTELLAEHFLARVRQLPSSALARFLQLMASSVHSKDLQIYLNSNVAESLLQSFHLAAAIQSPQSDSLFVVDANIGANKANSFIINTMDDQVSIDAQGNATHHTTISYAWLINGQIYGQPLYRDYARVYVPPGSRLQVQNGWQPRGTSEAFGREVWAGFFTLSYGQTRTITLIWTTPGVASKVAKGWHYQYLIQRQAGVQWIVHLRLTLPPCAVATGREGGLVASARQSMLLNQPLNEDLTVGISYTC